RTPAGRDDPRARPAPAGCGEEVAGRTRLRPRRPRPPALVPGHAGALAAHLGRLGATRGAGSRRLVTRRRSYAVVLAACVVPRLVVLLYERGSILAQNTEKSDSFATTFVHSGTYGFIPGQPSAWTQPGYSFFLIPIYWIFGRNWPAVGLAQIALAAATALIVYEAGRRFLSQRAGLIAAVVATLNPYLIWHDVHVNREIVDQLLAAAIVYLTLLAAERTAGHIRAVAIGLGVVLGVAILANSRLLLLPLVLAAYLLWQRRTWILPALCVGASV